ncbi:MAG: nuclear transport factor 2 family protein, partial [Cyanobacteria bacterium P01_F01_bin.42]
SALPARQKWISVGLWLLAASYIYILLLSPTGQIVPGAPAWATQAATWKEVIGESTNFFFVVPLFNKLGIDYLTAPAIHPVDQALFNLVMAWIFMFLPLLTLDARSQKLPKTIVWVLSLFLTNAFMIPYMATRARQPLPESPSPQSKGITARIFSIVGIVVSITALLWFWLAMPEVGDGAARIQYFWSQFTTSRVFFAFCVDLVFFALFQAVLMGAVETSPRKRWLRFIPVWGLAAWLLA